MNSTEKVLGLETSLFSLRLGVFVVMFMWTLDKLINPGHTVSIFQRYYMIEGLGESLVYVLGALQLILVLSFVAGLKKRFTYGAVLLLHFLSTISTWGKLIDPWSAPNLLFYTAIPMLAAAFTLYKLRDHDNYLTLDKKIKSV